MKSLGKLRKFALHKSDAKEKGDRQTSAHLDELAQASQDMQDMRNCYDSLLSAAAATANNAYEFSESLQEMGTCLLEKTALHDDGESGRALLKLGKLQLELQKLVDSYRSHVIMTITNPSESLLSELRKVEEMKLQCDEKREIYEYMMAQHREKGRLRSGKGESFTSQQLQAAREQYDEVARLCVFRVESLKQGQCRSLLTQAARHHAAQLNLFRKGLKSLEAVDSHIRLVTEKQHIDYQLSELDYGEDEEDEGLSSYERNEAGELSFDYRQNNQGLERACSSRNSMELDRVDVAYPRASKSEDAEINLGKTQVEQVFSRQPWTVSHSAPIFAEKFDPVERIKEMRPTTGKFNTYVLPTPADAKSSTSRTSTSITHSSPSLRGSSQNLWHSSPLDTDKHETNAMDGNLSVLPTPPLADGVSLQQLDAHNTHDTKKNKRQAFSDPLASNPRSTKPSLSTSGPITSTELPHLVSGLLSRVPIPQPSSSQNVPRSASPPLVSSPRISELHELPRPPGNLASKPAGSSGMIGHSVPLVFRNQDGTPTNKNPSLASNASSLHPPPLIFPRSFSIPSSNQRAMAVRLSKLLESPQIPEKADEVASPPLTPISLSNMKSLVAVSEVAPDSRQIRDA
ncbi:unnamed protein product [Ilex paraguariensis]|uniref:Hydroxyproline-rich glycoprotein family protein n=1 Tax=Ilex paraguariensis TaxID=185542 RepID=A0ABC8U4B9_9AQUA